ATLAYLFARRHLPRFSLSLRFVLTAATTTEIYTLSLHDALPICGPGGVEVEHRGLLGAGGAGPDGDERGPLPGGGGPAGGRRPEVGRAHVWTPVTDQSRMPSSALKKKKAIDLLPFRSLDETSLIV